MKKGTVIARSAKKEEGKFLPMKESAEREAKKSEEQQREELCNFIKNSFCVDGEVSMIYGEIPNVPNIHFLLKDSRRGTFRVTMN